MSRTVRLRHDQWLVNREKQFHLRLVGELYWPRRYHYNRGVLTLEYYEKHWKRVVRSWRDGAFSKPGAEIRRMQNAECRAKAKMDFIRQMRRSEDYVVNLNRNAHWWYSRK